MLPNKPSLPAINQRSVSDWKGSKFELAVPFLLSPDNRISLVVTVFSLFFFLIQFLLLSQVMVFVTNLMLSTINPSVPLLSGS